jgi:hypothetical protein
LLLGARRAAPCFARRWDEDLIRLKKNKKRLGYRINLKKNRKDLSFWMFLGFKF